MTRKITAIITATLLMLALLPAGIAFAAAHATAELVEGLEVFPGNGQSYTIRVDNDEAPGGLPLPLPIGGAAGETIRSVDITLPTADGIRNSAVAVEPPAGWEVRRTSIGSLHTVTFFGGELEPGSSQEFSFPVDVTRPNLGDRSGEFIVAVSDTADGQTQEPASAVGDGLSSLVRTLRVLDFAPVAPPLALLPNRDMTSGGQVVYRATFENLALSGQDVSATVDSSSNDDVEQPDPVTVPGGGSASVDIPINVVQEDGDDTRTFELVAESARSIVDGADDEYLVLAPADITLQDDDFRPKVINTHSLSRTWDFVIPSNKSGTPGLDDFDSVTMSFADNEISCVKPTYARGQVDDVEVECSGSGIEGDHGTHDVTFIFEGTDDNGVAFLLERTFDNLLRIDNLLPILNIDLDLPTGQSAAKTGDPVTVHGSVDAGPEGSEVTLKFLEIRSSAGADDTITVVEDVSMGQGDSFSYDVTLEFDLAGGTDTHTFFAIGHVEDEAENQASEETLPEIFDDVAPLLPIEAHVVSKAAYGDNPAIEIIVNERHELRGGCNPDLWRVEENSVVDVLYSNGDSCQGGAGDDPQDHTRVLVLASALGVLEEPSVEYNPRSGLFDQDILGLPVNDALEQLGLEDLSDLVGDLGTVEDGLESVLGPVQDSPLGVVLEELGLGGSLFEHTDQLRDGAVNSAVRSLIDTIWMILPRAPIITGQSLRDAGNEPGVCDPCPNGDEDVPVFFTRFAGNDLVIQVRGIHEGWEAEVFGDGQSITETHTDGNSEQMFVTVPLGSVSPGSRAEFTRFVRFHNIVGAGEEVEFTVVVDRRLPQVVDSQRTALDPATGDATISVSIQDDKKIWSGDSHAADWRVWEHTDDEDIDEDRRWYPVASVNGSQSSTWELSVRNMRGEDFGAAEYLMVRDNGNRLTDRAGNQLANTISE